VEFEPYWVRRRDVTGNEHVAGTGRHVPPVSAQCLLSITSHQRQPPRLLMYNISRPVSSQASYTPFTRSSKHRANVEQLARLFWIHLL